MQSHCNKAREHRSDGISEVVGFVIILGVMVAGMSLYLTYAVPDQGREEEIKVMDSVRAWFVDYKSGVDQLWLNSPLAPASFDGEDSTLHGSTIGQVTLRNVIDTGTVREKGFVGRYLPLLAPIPASAEVSIRSNEFLTIEVRPEGATDPEKVYDSKVAPALSYSSHNNYYLQQEYFYQLGGVFLRQWDMKGGPNAERVTLIASPPLSLHLVEEGGEFKTTVSFVIENLDVTTRGIGSMSPIRVSTRLKEDPAIPPLTSGGPLARTYSEVILTVAAADDRAAEAWGQAFSRAATRNGFDPGYYTISVDPSQNLARLSVNGPTGENDVYLELLEANFELGLENVPTMIE
jgi:hypothetical protein